MNWGCQTDAPLRRCPSRSNFKYDCDVGDYIVPELREPVGRLLRQLAPGQIVESFDALRYSTQRAEQTVQRVCAKLQVWFQDRLDDGGKQTALDPVVVLRDVPGHRPVVQVQVQPICEASIVVWPNVRDCYHNLLLHKEVNAVLAQILDVLGERHPGHFRQSHWDDLLREVRAQEAEEGREKGILEAYANLRPS